MDLEFAFMGPASFDVGMLLANYIFSYYCHMSNPENHDQRRKFANSMIDMCKLTGKFGSLKFRIYDNDYLTEMC